MKPITFCIVVITCALGIDLHAVNEQQKQEQKRQAIKRQAQEQELQEIRAREAKIQDMLDFIRALREEANKIYYLMHLNKLKNYDLGKKEIFLSFKN